MPTKAMRLRDLRRALRKTQTELSAENGAWQSHISRIERSHNPHMGSVRRYVESLGATMKVLAVLPDGRRFLLDFEQPVQAKAKT